MGGYWQKTLIVMNCWLVFPLPGTEDKGFLINIAMKYHIHHAADWTWHMTEKHMQQMSTCWRDSIGKLKGLYYILG